MASLGVSNSATGSSSASVRLAELVAALSLGVDLGFGQPMEHVLRQCIIALRLADRIGLDDGGRLIVYYTALLVNVGCHADAHEQAKWFGDDIGLKALKYHNPPRSAAAVAASLRLPGGANPPLRRFRVGLEFGLSGHRDLNGMIEHALLARSLAAQLRLPQAVQGAVGAAYEQWDGRGWPGELSGEAVPIASRLAQLAEFVEVAHRVSGVEAAVVLAQQRGGSQFDPLLVKTLCQDAESILGNLDRVQTWDVVLAAEPALVMTLSGQELDDALLAVANLVDLKSPYRLGHARALSELAWAAGAQLGLDNDDLQTLRRAGLVSGLGRLGVSNSIWDKPGPLGAGESERVRMHPCLTERMLDQSSWLAPLGSLAAQQHERLDGSGYPRGLSGAAISKSARILSAADAYQSMREPRPYRDPLPADAAASQLRAEVKAGHLDASAVEVVLSAAGHRVPRHRDDAVGLTRREVEILRLVAQGLSSGQIAKRLAISPKTARNHIEHIYTKIGAASRARVGLFAMQHGFIPEEEYSTP
jgi:HD-GYP domain-containing protein (c-di-GMP phosphodiesterase class II)